MYDLKKIFDMTRQERLNKYMCTALLLAITLIACNGRTSEASTIDTSIRIERFDQELPRYIQATDTSAITAFQAQYAPFFPVYCRHILGLNDSPDYREGLQFFLHNEAIARLYADVQTTFAADTTWVTQLSNAFARYERLFPGKRAPRLLTHVSGLNQSVITMDSLLSISLDCYLGADYPLYEQRYYEYERPLHKSCRIAIDAAEVWLRTHYPYQSERNALLDRMVYEGKILHILSLLFPESSEAELLGYTDAQIQWCRDNEGVIWHQIVSKKHLFNTESMLINKYIEPAPFVSVLHPEAPGKLGRRVGWQIVKAYLESAKESPAQLLETTDNAGAILSKSKYNG